MPHPVQALFLLLARATDRELARQLQYLKVENRILRDKLPKKITISHSERARLLKFGQPLGTAINVLITIVVPGTFVRWVREACGKQYKISATGRPKKPVALRELILKIARETGWGYTRVLGEVRKLTSQRVSRQTVKNLLKEHGIEPGPRRGEGTWDEFVKIHAKTLWQADFFSKRCWTIKGLRDLYVLVFLNVATRRVYVSTATQHPNAEWITQRTQEFCRHTRDHQLPAELIFHDADTKFGKAFDLVLFHHGLRSRRLKPRSPNMNAFVERWIQSIQVECLDHFVVLGEVHLNHLVQEYVQHYHDERPHQGLDNKLITPATPPDEKIPLLPQIICHERLGALLKHYERRAA